VLEKSAEEEVCKHPFEVEVEELEGSEEVEVISHIPMNFLPVLCRRTTIVTKSL
jgi:hypothetical protein